jgi:hypothetical protein
MAIDFQAVCNSEKARDWLIEAMCKSEEVRDELYEIWEIDALQEEANNVLTLAWSGGMCSGEHLIVEWKEMYFFLGDEDCGQEGPFKSLEDVLPLVERYRVGSFTDTSLRPALYSKVVPLERLLEIGHDLVQSEGDEIDINHKRFVLSGGELAEKAPNKID